MENPNNNRIAEYKEIAEAIVHQKYYGQRSDWLTVTVADQSLLEQMVQEATEDEMNCLVCDYIKSPASPNGCLCENGLPRNYYS